MVYLDVTQFLNMDDIVEHLDENNYFNTLLICYLVNIATSAQLNKSCELLLVIIYLKMYERYGLLHVNAIILSQPTSYFIRRSGLINILLDDFIDLLEYYVSSDAIFDELQNTPQRGRIIDVIYSTMLYRIEQITDDISKNAYIVATTYLGKKYYQNQMPAGIIINNSFFDDYYEKQITETLKNIYANSATNPIIEYAFELMRERNTRENAAIAQRMDDLARGIPVAVEDGQDMAEVQEDIAERQAVPTERQAAEAERQAVQAQFEYINKISEETKSIFGYAASMGSNAIEAHQAENSDFAKNSAQEQATYARNAAKNSAQEQATVILENTKMIAKRQAIRIAISQIRDIPKDQIEFEIMQRQRQRPDIQEDQIYIEIMQSLGITQHQLENDITPFVQEQIGFAEEQVRDEQNLNIEMYSLYSYIYVYVNIMAGIRWASMTYRPMQPEMSPISMPISIPVKTDKLSMPETDPKRHHRTYKKGLMSGDDADALLRKRREDKVRYDRNERKEKELGTRRGILGGKNTHTKTHRKKYTNCKSKKNNKTRRHKKRRTHKKRRS